MIRIPPLPADEVAASTYQFDRSSLRDVELTLYGEPVEPGKPVELEFGNVPLELFGFFRCHEGPEAWVGSLAAGAVCSWRQTVLRRGLGGGDYLESPGRR